MAITYDPEVEPIEAPPTETATKRQVGGWSPRPQPRIGLDMDSDDDMLLVENRTEQAWTISRDYHELGIIDPGEMLVFHICKRGSLKARPVAKEDVVEYLVITLNYYVNQVYIYRRKLGQDVDVFDMRSI